MNEEKEERRLFLGFGVEAPWPKDLPLGRLLEESQRHITLAFLGQTNFAKLYQSLSLFPKPSFQIGLVGQFDQCLLLPRQHPNVIAWHVKWLENATPLLSFQKTLMGWLQQQGFSPLHPEREFLPHVTLCRHSFIAKDWLRSFTPLPLLIKDIHLYESLGHSKYESRWHYRLKPAFEEMEHTADIAFWIRGTDFQQLYDHAQVALAFKYPPLLSYFSPGQKDLNLETIVMNLNDMIAKADQEIGCPIKAISFHDKLIEEEPNVLTWEMIVDV